MSDKKVVKPTGIEGELEAAGLQKRALSRRNFLRVAGAAAGTAVASGAALDAFAAGKKTKIDTPIITCSSSTQVSISIQVCAPSGATATGLPAGFSIQWMTCDEFDQFGWPLNSDCLVGVDAGCPASFCKASLSGNANLSRYNLSPGQCATVNLGEFLFDEGASTTCPNALVCGTCYVFRAFGHATSTLNRSDFTANLECSTLDCENRGGGCTLTQGYWKTHGPAGCITGNNTNEWPDLTGQCTCSAGDGLCLGSVCYSADQLCSILNTPAGGNGLIALAHQLIAAKLNILNGADGTDANACIADADALIGGLVVPPVGAGYLAPSATSADITCLANYNEGATGPGHCS